MIICIFEAAIIFSLIVGKTKLDPSDYERIAKWDSTKVREELCSAQEVLYILASNLSKKR